MLRPKVTVLIINDKYSKFSHVPVNPKTGKPNITDIYKDEIHPSSVEIEENKQGITGSITSVRARNNIKIGDKINIKLEYLGIKESVTFISGMVVIDTQLDSKYQLTFKFMDEFQYYCQITDFIPLSPTDEQKVFLNSKYGISFSDSDISTALKDNVLVEELLEYIKGLIEDKMYYHIKGDDIYQQIIDMSEAYISPMSIKFNNKISDLIKILSDNYFTHVFSTSYISKFPFDFDINFQPTIIIETILGLENFCTTHTCTCVDNINIIEDNLIRINPLITPTCSVGIFKNKKTKDKPEEVEEWYAYWQTDGRPTVTKDKQSLPTTKDIVVDVDGNKYGGPIQLYNTVTVGNAEIITEDKRKEYTLNMLLSSEFFGYRGILKTFQQGINVTNAVKLEFRNKMRNSADRWKKKEKIFKIEDKDRIPYSIGRITREYDSNGLFMTIEPSNLISKCGDL
jgi:hypothetical protein